VGACAFVYTTLFGFTHDIADGLVYLSLLHRDAPLPVSLASLASLSLSLSLLSVSLSLCLGLSVL
jgi:hypothetical protein